MTRPAAFGAVSAINLELFCCSGGMAEGFRRAGVHFDIAIDFEPDHCDSYERNIGHRPIAMDVRDTLRLVRAGHLRWDVDLLVADPPCTPWSRAGKRLGTADERDMLEVTCDLIAALRPRRYLIGNVPGLDDAGNLAIVQRVIGGLSRHGYCTADFAQLDAADYGGVILCPEHAQFAGRLSIPTHVMGCAALIGSVVRLNDHARDAAGRSTSPPAETSAGDARRDRRRTADSTRPANKASIGAVAAIRRQGIDTCACGSHLVDESVSIGSSPRPYWDGRSDWEKSSIMSTRTSVTTSLPTSGCLPANPPTNVSMHAETSVGACTHCRWYATPQHRVRPWWFGHRTGTPCIRWPAPTHCDPLDLCSHALPGIEPLKPWVTCRQALGHLAPDDLGRLGKMRKHNDHGAQKGSVADRPERTVGTSDGNNLAMPRTRHDEPVHTSEIDSPARSITTQCRAPGHATTIILNERHAPAAPDAPAPTLGAKYRGQGAQVLSMEPHHPPSYADEPSNTIRAGSGGGANRAMMLEGESARRKKRPASTKGAQSTRTMSPDAPSTTVQAREDRKGSGSPVLDCPWSRPATTVTSRPGLGPPGHHDESFAIMSLPDAVILSERAAAILQGFPEGWHFAGETKKARWSQLGQAMPIALAQAVGRSVVAQNDATLSRRVRIGDDLGTPIAPVATYRSAICLEVDEGEAPDESGGG